MLLDNNMENRVPILCERDRCTACGACEQSCPKEAISMKEDEKGFLYPEINEDKCVRCLVCEKKCSLVKGERTLNEIPDVYACWHKDINVRLQSSSGGAFSAIAEWVLENHGYVWGAGYKENLQLAYLCVKDINDLDRIRRSKYVQSEVGNTFVQIKEQLKQEKLVLFTGTSCHIRGLLSFISTEMKGNLITIDFICHGVPSPKVFRKYLDWIENAYQDKLKEFNFRDKRYGWDNGVLTVGQFERIGERKFLNKENSYFYGMLHDLFIRPCCYQCLSNGLQREADFTIADFWGIGKYNAFVHENEKTKGISLLALNSEKAKSMFYHGIKEKLYYEKRTLEEAYEGNWNYRFSARKNKQTHDFWQTFQQIDSWEELLYFFEPSFIEKCKLLIKRYGGPVIANRLRKIMKK